MTYGFEREYFVLRGFDVVVAATEGLPADGCGYLAEARGLHSPDVINAAHLLLADEYRLRKLAESKGLALDSTSRKLDKTFKFNAMRAFGKTAQTDFSMSGKWNSPSLSHAGLHIHFGRELVYTTKEGQKVKVGAGIINIPAIVLRLDQRFKAEIKAAKRALGLYKIQPWGFEYRSLPATIDPLTVAEFVQDSIRGL
jgi:hypothetical protein